MAAGISRAMIFSNRVLLITFSIHSIEANPRWLNNEPAYAGSCRRSFHHEGAVLLFRLGGQALAEIAHDLVLDQLAAAAPALCAGELLDAAAQSAETQQSRRLAELGAQFIAQSGKEEQFQAVVGFVRDV